MNCEICGRPQGKEGKNVCTAYHYETQADIDDCTQVAYDRGQERIALLEKALEAAVELLECKELKKMVEVAYTHHYDLSNNEEFAQFSLERWDLINAARKP